MKRPGSRVRLTITETETSHPGGKSKAMKIRTKGRRDQNWIILNESIVGCPRF